MLARGLGIVVVVLLVSCGDDSPLCAPGSAIGCVGPRGCGGGQICADDGNRYGDCFCGIDAGTGDSGMQMDAAVADTGTPLEDAAVPDAALSDAALFDAALSDAALSDAALSDAALSDAALSDAALYDASARDAAAP